MFSGVWTKDTVNVRSIIDKVYLSRNRPNITVMVDEA